MGHALILGQTECGKTSLAKVLATLCPRVAVYSTYKSDWGKNVVFFATDLDALVTFAQTNKNCNIFIDESGESINRDRQYQFFATRARHFGHRVFFITQRANQLTPTIRLNCSALYVFRQSPKDAQLLYDDFGHDEILEATKLKKYEYIELVTTCGQCVKKMITLKLLAKCGVK